jgi:hypothetical protein
MHREIIMPSDSSKIRHGYAYLGDYLNFRQTTINNQPQAKKGDILSIQKMPVNSYLLDLRVYIYPERITNYNKLVNIINPSTILQFSICPYGSNDIPLDAELFGVDCNSDCARFTEQCLVPRNLLWEGGLGRRWNMMVPTKSWLPLDYRGKEAELLCRISVEEPDNKYECHVWYTWCEL